MTITRSPIPSPNTAPQPSGRGRRKVRRSAHLSLAHIAYPERQLPSETRLYDADTPATCLYVVREGTLKGVLPSSLRQARIADIYGDGDVLGLAALSSGQHSERMVTLEPCVVTPLHPQHAMLNHAVRDYIVQALSKQLQRSRTLITNYELPVGARISQMLISLTKRFGMPCHDQPEHHHLPLCLTHEDFASLSSSSRVTVTRILGELRHKQALCGSRGSYQVDITRLKQATDDYVMQVI